MQRIIDIAFGAFLCGLLAVAYHTKAQAVPPPLTCPPRNWIINAGLSPFMVQDQGGNWYGGFLSESVGTMNKWTFIFGPVVAANRTEARNKLLAALPTIQLRQGPIHVNANQWQCVYHTIPSYSARLFTPPIGCESCANPQ